MESNRPFVVGDRETLHPQQSAENARLNAHVRSFSVAEPDSEHQGAPE